MTIHFTSDDDQPIRKYPKEAPAKRRDQTSGGLGAMLAKLGQRLQSRPTHAKRQKDKLTR